MDWSHWFEILLAGFAGFFLYDFRKMQKDFGAIKDHLADVKGDLKVLVKITETHEKRMDKIEGGSRV